MRKRRLLLAVLVLVATACSEESDEQEGGDAVVHVAGAWVDLVATDAGALYFTAHNAGSEEDRLIGASTTAATRTEIMEGEGPDMRVIESVPIGPDEELVFEPSTYHVMLFQPTAEVGSSISVTLTWEKAGDVTVEAVVEG